MSFNQGIPGPATLINSSSTLLYGNSASANALSVQQLGAGNVASFRTTTGATALFVGANGNVGVGTASPGYTLTSAGTICGPYSTIPLLACYNQSAGNFTYANVISCSYINSRDSTQIFAPGNGSGGSAGNPIMTLQSGPLVGIGTTNPGYLLDLCNGDIRTQNGGNVAGVGGAINFGANAGYGPMSQIKGALDTAAGSVNDQGSVVFLTRPLEVNPYTVRTNLTERMRITSGGFVGIGTTNPGNLLTVNNGTTDGTVCRLVGGNGSTSLAGPSIDFSISNLPTYSGASIKSLNSYTDGSGQSAHLAFYTANWNGSTGSLQERMRITSAGNVGIGTNPRTILDVTGDSGITVSSTNGAQTITYIYTGFTTNGGGYNGFTTGSGVVSFRSGSSGGVTLLSSAASWSAYSDARLKNIVEPISNALSKVDQINPVIYTLKDDETNVRRVGVIAQDVLKVQPEAVGAGEDGMLSVRYTELIPLALAAIKELSAENTSLKTQMASLEQRLSALEAKLNSQ